MAGGGVTADGTAEEASSVLLPIDALAAGYLLATGAVGLAALTPTGLGLAAAHAAAAGLIGLLARRPPPTRGVAAFLRVAYPLLATPALYLELAVLNQLHFPGYFDGFVQGWEAAVFGMQPSVEAGERLPWLWLSETLHLGYVSYYAVVPAAAIAAFAARGAAGLERVAFAVALAFFACYACFAVFPVAGPRYEYPPIDGPQAGGVLFGIVHRVLESGSSKGTAFPSSHVAATVTAWLAAGRESRRAFRLLGPFAVALTLGTVYGRFHYAVDAIAGLAVAAACAAWAPWLLLRLRGGAGAFRWPAGRATPEGPPGVERA